MTDAQLEQLLVLDAQPGPALPISAADADALVEAALAGAGFGPAGGPSSGGGSAPATAARIGGAKLATIAIGVLLAVFVIAFLIGRHRAHQAAPPPPDAAPDAAVITGTATPPIDAAPEPTPVIEPGETMPTPEPPTPEPPPAHHAAAEPRAVNDLLGEANAKRAAHAWRESDALYARVVKRVPGSVAAQTALVASGSLHLEHLGDPRGAADRFKRALAISGKGAMAEEARWGIAEAARARKDTAAEAAALDDFLAHHPDSALAAQARARRQELK